MTLSTSAVAVCCCSDSRSSLSRRVFSMAMTACAAKVLHQLDLLVGERPNLLTIDDDDADQLVLLEHRHDEKSARARESTSDERRFALECRPLRRMSAMWSNCFVSHDAAEWHFRARDEQPGRCRRIRA